MGWDARDASEGTFVGVLERDETLLREERLVFKPINPDARQTTVQNYCSGRPSTLTHGENMQALSPG